MSDLSRRNFGRLLGAGALSASLSGALSGPAQAAGQHRRARLVKPARLRAGDLVGLVAPAGHVDDGQIERCIANLTSLGLRVRLGQHIREVRGNFAGPVAHRLADLHAMFADREVKAVWAATGGSGAIGLLDGLDYPLIRRNPKILIGFSDITALLLAIYRKCDLVTFHGPVGISTWSEFSLAHLRAVLMEPQPHYTMALSAENIEKAATMAQFGARAIHHGVAEGHLIGGNLSLVAALAGTPYAAEFRRAIVFLEDIGEAPYRIDRMLRQLELSQGFAQARALMLGVFEKCGPPDSEPSLSLAETIDDHLVPLAVPAVYGYSFGHIRQQYTLPLGVMARLDTRAQTITLLEAAVS